MKSIKNVLICGLGAIGSIYAQKISECPDIDLKILVDENRFEKYKKFPVIYNGQEMKLNYILPCDDDFKADLIIISVKFNGLIEVCENIKNFVKNDTIILSLLNGVTSEEIIAGKYGYEKLLLSYFIGHSAVRNGREVSFDNVGKVVFGKSERFGTDENVRLIKDFFEKIGADYEISDDISYSLWLKFMLNVSVNPLTALMKMKFENLFNNPKAMDFAVEIMKEVQLIAKAERVAKTEYMIEQTIQNLQTMAPEGKTSMLQDVEAKRLTENEMLSGTIVKLGAKHGISTPKNKVLYELINVYEMSINKKED